MKLPASISPNTKTIDGITYVIRADRLWADDDTFALYTGRASGVAFRVWAIQHGITRIRHGRKAYSAKDEIDLKTGAIAAV